MSMITIEVTDQTARDLADRAHRLGMSVGELVEAMAGQFLPDQDNMFDLSDEQMAQIRSNIEDPAPSIPHEAVVAGIDRMLSGRK